jgi:hypothetical protein
MTVHKPRVPRCGVAISVRRACRSPSPRGGFRQEHAIPFGIRAPKALLTGAGPDPLRHIALIPRGSLNPTPTAAVTNDRTRADFKG